MCVGVPIKKQTWKVVSPTAPLQRKEDDGHAFKTIVIDQLGFGLYCYAFYVLTTTTCLQHSNKDQCTNQDDFQSSIATKTC